jgi:branched-chain amino acid transport system substrate-binding protein
VYAVQGYDAAQMLGIGLAAVKGDLKRKKPTSPPRCARPDRQPARQVHAVGQAHNPVQDIYLRQVKGKENKVVGRAVKALADPAAAARCN